jgi:hypothetical protein
MSKILHAVGVWLFLACMQVGCGGGVSSEEQAQRAYLGLDKSIGKALVLGFAGFNAASSANISPQSTSGDARREHVQREHHPLSHGPGRAFTVTAPLASPHRTSAISESSAKS